MSRMVQGPLAGGWFSISTAELPATGLRVTVLTTPLGSHPLEPDQARQLGVGLIEGAAEAERDPADSWPDDEPEAPTSGLHGRTKG